MWLDLLFPLILIGVTFLVALLCDSGSELLKYAWCFAAFVTVCCFGLAAIFYGKPIQGVLMPLALFSILWFLVLYSSRN
ncbi:MAG TPA: hypothetical protein VN578_11030 [Candidatus Binatia bacterium]|jgi:hypothetical protein|nr:hypothetical protein [Candidatus Binatia bacterium]